MLFSPKPSTVKSPRNGRTAMHDVEAERRRYLALLLRLGEQLEQGVYRQVYCNRDLDHDHVTWIGFDMDYTLAVYEQGAFDELTHRMTVARMVERLHYPEEVGAIPYRDDFAIRGLTVDRETGNILKLDAHRHVERAFHGFEEVPHEQLDPYRKRPPNLSLERYSLIDTLFELPEAYLFAACVDLLESKGMTPDYGQLADDIRKSIDSIHGDGSLKAVIMADLGKYMLPSKQLGDTLHRFRSAGKRLFLMTNSYATYTDAVMTYLLEEGPSDYRDWKGYFDVIITGARKPSFFAQGNAFLRLSDTGEAIGEESERLRRGVVYQHGNIRDFERMVGARGDEILYVGDHIYGDILRSKRDSAWRTCMIIPELEREMRVAEAHAEERRAWMRLEDELHLIDDAISLETEFKHRMKDERELLLPEGTPEDTVRDAERALRMIDQNADRLRKRRKEIIEEYASSEAHAQHPVWGPLMKTGNEHSIFGEQVESHADLYTSRVTNFLAQPAQYQRSPRDRMPHEVALLERATRKTRTQKQTNEGA